MVTLVGTQKNFIDALKSLIKLDYAASASYREAIEHIKSAEFKSQLKEFKADHDRHIKELSDIAQELGYEPPEGAGLKQLLTQGKVMFAELIGDKAILMALKTNEDDTNVAYERLNDHPQKFLEAEKSLKQGLADERKHRAWIEKTIKSL
jgi:rubrerythrin